MAFVFCVGIVDTSFVFPHPNSGMHVDNAVNQRQPVSLCTRSDVCILLRLLKHSDNQEQFVLEANPLSVCFIINAC